MTLEYAALHIFQMILEQAALNSAQGNLTS
jgi:hypothetical protein